MRPNAYQALLHPFFDQLRDPNTRLPNGEQLPPLFNWLREEIEYATAEVIQRISLHV